MNTVTENKLMSCTETRNIHIIDKCNIQFLAEFLKTLQYFYFLWTKKNQPGNAKEKHLYKASNSS